MLDMTISWTADLLHHGANLAADPVVPNPGGGEKPPFGDAATTLLKWGVWGALFSCVGGFVIIGARMGLQHRRGESGNHMGSLFIVGFATILIMGAYTIVKELAGAG
jgi:hypothetical protein